MMTQTWQSNARSGCITSIRNGPRMRPERLRCSDWQKNKPPSVRCRPRRKTTASLIVSWSAARDWWPSCTNRYSVPAHLIGRALTARIHATRIELFADQERVATHTRSRQQHARIITPAHFEAAFSTKPRGRVMVYRDWLCDLAPVVSSYVRELCHKRRADMKEQLLALYELAQDSGLADFVAALELAAEQQMYGAEYVRAILAPPVPPAPDDAAQAHVDHLLACVPTQQEVERDLAQYERYVANRERVLDALLASTGEQA